jgi:hypothetical protein
MSWDDVSSHRQSLAFPSLDPSQPWTSRVPRDLVVKIAGNISCLRNINTSNGNLLSVEESMIDAVLNVTVFAALVLCIAGFGAWAHKRVP